MTKDQFLQKHDQIGSQTVTVEVMLEAFDQVLIPAIGEMMDKRFAEVDKRFAKQENTLKDYIDRKFADHTAEMVKRLDKRFEQESRFHKKVIELFKKNRIGTPEDIAFLEGLAQ